MPVTFFSQKGSFWGCLLSVYWVLEWIGECVTCSGGYYPGMPPNVERAGYMAKIEVCNIKKEFHSSRTKEVVLALNDICLEANEGEFVTLVGPSGCGKSTLIKIIAGLESKDNGYVLQIGRASCRAR